MIAGNTGFLLHGDRLHHKTIADIIQIAKYISAQCPGVIVVFQTVQTLHQMEDY